MRRILLPLMLFATLFVGINAQEGVSKVSDSNKWVITAGVNTVDYRSYNTFSDSFKDYVGKRGMNFGGIPFRLTVERSLNKAFSLEMSASINKITKGREWTEDMPLAKGHGFATVDGKVKWDLNSVIGETSFFDPYLEAGVGIAGCYRTEHVKAVYVNMGAGANFWVTDRLGLNLNTSYSHNFEESGNDYFQHSLGLAYRFTYPNDNNAYDSHMVNTSSKWILSFGANFLDVRTQSDLKGFFIDYMNGDIEDVNTNGWPFRVAIERKLNDAFGVQLGFSKGDLDIAFAEKPVDDTYWAADLKATYDINNLIGDTRWFDPFINLGIGYSKVGEFSDFKVNAGYGANFWMFENFGLRAESSYNHAFNQNGSDFFQHTAGVVYRFAPAVKDTDKDGLYDDVDACPKVAGLKEFKGCPDTDGDGIKDSDDACPEVAGLKELNGCPDTDGDGITDKNDKCPNVAGPKANNGCPWGDADRDGITDNLDKCPQVAGVASNNGCPEVKEEVVEVIETDCSAEFNEINNVEVYFDFDRVTLKYEAKAKLDRVAELLKTMKCNVELLTVSGYADPTGSKSYNLGLSRRRAQVVKTYLTNLGVTNITIVEQGLGETNSRKENRYNRRVDIRIK